MFPKVGIILINYKDYAERFLEDCCESLRHTNYPRDRHRVYLVDNATTVESREYLKAAYPEATIVPVAHNAGWGGGNNAGITQARADGCTDYVFLNLDTIVEPEWLKELVEVAYANPRIGICQSKLLLWPVGPEGVKRINSVGNAIHFLGFGYCLGYGVDDAKLKTQNGKSLDISYASGAAMYVKGEVLARVGVFNEDLFMYHDDLEFCLRAKLRGWRVVLAPRSVVWHKFETSRGKTQIYFMERNRLICLLLFYKIPTLIMIAPAFLIMELGILVKSLISGWWRPKLKSWAYFLKPHIWIALYARRRAIQSTRTISDRDLIADFTGQILFQGESTPLFHYRAVRSPLLRYVVNPLMAAYWAVDKKVIWW